MAHSKQSTFKSDNSLECSICQSEYTDPRLLPCLHTFCLKCLRKYCSEELERGKNPFCPLCRTEFTVPDEGLKKLQSNNIIARLVRDKEIPEGKDKKSKCMSQCVDVDADVFCIDCKKSYCFNCRNAHDKFSPYKEHRIVSIEERQTEEKSQIMKPDTCTVHEEDMIKYCSDCKKLLCHKCPAREHDKHQCKKLSDAAKLKKNEISEYRSNLEKCIKDKTTKKENQKTKANLGFEEISTARQDIENSISEIIKHILSKKGEFLTALEKLEKTNRQAAESSKCEENTSESIGAEFSGFLSYTEMVVERGTECEIIEAADELHSKAEKLIRLYDKPTEHEADQNCRFLTPISSEINKLKNQIFGTDFLRILDSATKTQNEKSYAHDYEQNIYEQINEPVKSYHQESRCNSKPLIDEELSSSGSHTAELEFTTASGINVTVDKGNIVHQAVDVIVNAANIRLLHGGGVAGAIRKACGDELDAESKQYIQDHKQLKIGEPMHTTSGKLAPRVKHVVHVAGPDAREVRNKQVCQQLLSKSFYNSLIYSNEILEARSIAIPAISSGIYEVPLNIVAQCSWDALINFDSYMKEREEKERHLKQIIFVNIDDKTVSAMHSAFIEQLKRTPNFEAKPGQQAVNSTEKRPRVLMKPDKPPPLPKRN